MIQAEMVVIGSLLTDSNSLSKVRYRLKPEMFTQKILGWIYCRFVEAADSGHSIDHITIIQKMGVVGSKADEVKALLSDCIKETMSAVLISSAVDAMINEYAAKEFRKIIDGARASPANVQEVMSDTVLKIQDLRTPSISGTTLKEITAETEDFYFKEREIKTVRIGISGVDGIIKTLEPGDITVIAARPAVGKSAFIVQMATNLSLQGKKIALFSLEMSREQVYERFMAHVGGLAMDRVRFAKHYIKDEEVRHKKALNFLRGNENIIIYADGKKTRCPRKASEIEAACVSAGADIAIIDYLQLMVPERYFNGNRAAEVGEISARTKQMATRLNMHVVNVCQLNRGSEYRTNKKPMLSDLRDSGAIEQDASNVIFLWNRDANDTSLKGVAVEKQRQGCVGSVNMKFDGEHMRFVSEENGKQSDYRGFKPVVDGLPFGWEGA